MARLAGALQRIAPPRHGFRCGRDAVALSPVTGKLGPSGNVHIESPVHAGVYWRLPSLRPHGLEVQGYAGIAFHFRRIDRPYPRTRRRSALGRPESGNDTLSLGSRHLREFGGQVVVSSDHPQGPLKGARPLTVPRYRVGPTFARRPAHRNRQQDESEQGFHDLISTNLAYYMWGLGPVRPTFDARRADRAVVARALMKPARQAERRSCSGANQATTAGSGGNEHRLLAAFYWP